MKFDMHIPVWQCPNPPGGAAGEVCHLWLPCYHLGFSILVYVCDITDHYGYYGELWAFVVDGLIETAKLSNGFDISVVHFGELLWNFDAITHLSSKMPFIFYICCTTMFLRGECFGGYAYIHFSGHFVFCFCFRQWFIISSNNSSTTTQNSLYKLLYWKHIMHTR